MFLLDTLLLAPGKAVLFMFEELAKKAQEEFLDDASVKQELQEIYALLEGGTISETEFEAREGRLLERLEQIARAKFGEEWGTSAMGMQRTFMDSDSVEEQDVSVLDGVTEGEVLPEVLSAVDGLEPVGTSTPVAGDSRPVMNLDMMSALRPLLERFAGGHGRQPTDVPATLVPALAAAFGAAPTMASRPEVALPEGALAAPAAVATVPPVVAAAPWVAATVPPPVASAVAPPVAAFTPPFATAVAPPAAVVTPPVAVPAAPTVAATFTPPVAAAVVPPAAAPAVPSVVASAPPLSMMQIIESSLRQLSILKMKVSAITAVARSDDGWRVTAEMLERRGVPDTSDLLGVYELHLDEGGNVLRYERTHIRRRCDLGR